MPDLRMPVEEAARHPDFDQELDWNGTKLDSSEREAGIGLPGFTVKRLPAHRFPPRSAVRAVEYFESTLARLFGWRTGETAIVRGGRGDKVTGKERALVEQCSSTRRSPASCGRARTSTDTRDRTVKTI